MLIDMPDSAIGIDHDFNRLRILRCHEYTPETYT